MFFKLIFTLFVFITIIYAIPNLPYLDSNGKVLEKYNIKSGGQCDRCIKNCQGKDFGCAAECCWACIPGRGGNCQCC